MTLAESQCDEPASIRVNAAGIRVNAKSLPYLLSKAGPLPAVHPKNAMLIESGRIYIAPPDRHMLIQKDYIRWSHGPQENLAPPAITVFAEV